MVTQKICPELFLLQFFTHVLVVFTLHHSRHVGEQKQKISN